MAFAPVFGQLFPATFSRAAAAAAVPWYLAGGAPTPIAVYQPKGAASLAASYVNIINPGTYDAAPGVAPTFDAATGWTFNGSSQYLDSGIVPAINQTWSAVVRFTNATAKDYAVLLGVQDIPRGNGVFDICPNSITAGRFYENPGALAIANGQTSGIMSVAGNAAYLNGIPESGTIPATPATANVYKIFLGARSVNNAPALYFNGKIQAIGVWNTSTNHATWMPAVSAAVALI